MKHKILIVDDEPAITRTLERLFREDLEVVTALSGEEGLAALAIHDVALIVSDQRMPGMTGVEFLKRSSELRPHCVRIILTGYTDVGDLVDAINSGVVYKYVTKPWANDDLMQTVKRGLSHHETIKAQHRLNLENQRLHERLTAADDCLLKLCSEILYLKDEGLRERVPRIRELALPLGQAAGLDAYALQTLAYAASLHPLADLHVPDDLLNRHTRLREDQETFLEACRERGLDLLADVPTFDEVVVAIRYLPENFDGSGRPRGLSGIQIPITSRILAVVKTFDDMISPSDGTDGISNDDAIAELQSEAGRRFDPTVVDAFCELIEKDEFRGITREEPLLVG